MVWTAEALGQVFFSTYPHEPTPVDPALVALSIGLSNTPIWGDLYDLYTGLTGYDPITGQYLMGWERLVNIVGVIPIPGVSGSNARHGVHAIDSLIDEGDDVARFIGAACSFDAETPVATDEGAIPISEIDVGDRVLAWNEATDATGYYTVTATLAHADPVIVHLMIDGETIETTPEHPFYAVASVPWLAAGERQGRWTLAGDLKAGDQIQQANGTTGVVQAVVFEAIDQVMYNLTVAGAHTFFVGDGAWLVHNSCADVFVDGVNLTHIFEGSNRGGFHYNGGTWHIGKAQIKPGQTLALDQNGLYVASVEFWNGNQWVPKKGQGISTFFPDHWSEQQIVDEIMGSFTYGTISGNKFSGRSPSGVWIEGWLNSTGDINTAYPIWGR